MAKKTTIKIDSKIDSLSQIGEPEIVCNMSDGSVWRYSVVRNEWFMTSPSIAEVQKSFDSK